MSTNNGNDLAVSQLSAEREARLPALTCEAHDLKRILTHLVDQISDADRRHSQALHMMQERLGALGTTAQGLREQLPRDMMPMIDKIEGGMTDLSDRLVEAEAQRRGEALAEKSPQKANQESAVGEKSAEPAAPALKSAMAADALDAFTRRAHVARDSSMPPIDNFDVIDLGADPRSEELWDAASADALARLYDSDDARLAGIRVPQAAANNDEALEASFDAAIIAVEAKVAAPAVEAQPTAIEVAAVTAPVAVPFGGPSSTEIATEVAAVQARSLESERQWLEQRFADVAVRLEQSLSGLKTETSLDKIDARFSKLELQLGEALNGSASHSDLASLQSIESQVEDLSAQLVSAQTHFSRLDTIELELRSLAERISTDKLARMIEQSAGKGADSDAIADVVANRVAQEMPRLEQAIQSIGDRLSADKLASLAGQIGARQPDAGAIARIVADEISQRMPQPISHDDPSGRLEELRSMIEHFVAEQRHGDEQTTTMLDTMQQAMIRMLDRMDAIEQPRYADPGAPAMEMTGYPESRRSGPADLSDYSASSHQEHGGRRNDDRIEGGAYAASEPERQPQPNRVETNVATVSTLRAAEQQAASGEASQPAGASANREDYIAAARRAARQVAETAPVEPEVAEPPRKSVTQKAGAKAAASGGGRGLSRVSMALICLVLVGASFVAVKTTILAPSSQSPAVSSRTSANDAATPQPTAEKRLQNLKAADTGDTDPRGAGAPAGKDAATPQRRGELSDQNRVAGERDHARAFDGVIAGAIPASQIQSQGSFVPGMSEFARSNLQDSPAMPAALTPDNPQGVAGAKSGNEMPPLTIGPNSLRMAAAKGDPSAEFEVGARFAEAKGVPQDLQQAVVWYQRSAAQGFPAAQYRLGSMYERGLGVRADAARARVWYERAAEQGVVKAMHNLAVLSAGRDSAATDYVTAAKWFMAASEHGLTDSQFNLAIMHDSGLGLERDAKQAYKWFTLAARAGDVEAARRRESLRGKLAPQELSEIEAELANWRPKVADNTVNDPRAAGDAWRQRAR